MVRERLRGTPYVRFTVLRIDGEPYRVWAAFRDRLVGARDVTAEGQTESRLRVAKDGADESGIIVVWRLMSSNHREVATSGAGFASVHAARAHAEATVQRAPRLVARLVAEDINDRFGWTLQSGATLAVIASRWHPSRRDLAISLALSRDALARADIPDVPTEPRAVVAVRRRPRPREGAADRRLADLPVIEAGPRRPINEIRRHDILGRGSG